MSDVIAPIANSPLIVRTKAQTQVLREYAKSKGLPERIYENFGIYANYMVPKIKVGKTFYDWIWVHWYIAENLNQAIFSNGTLLTIEVGPQIGKSILTALFISYVHGLSPDSSVIYATYNETKAVDFTKRYVTKFMTDKKYKNIFPHIALKFELDKKDSSAERQIQSKTSTMKDTEFTLLNTKTKKNYLGGYRCFGLDQGIHGVPGDIFLIDDYVDKGDSVKSENFRNKRTEWFYNDMPSRLQDNNSIVIALCTRWYYADIIGLLHSAYEQDIVPDCIAEGIIPPVLNKVRIRAEYRISDDNPKCDPRTREGEKLWKVHTLKYSLAKKGAYFSAMYNCDPSDTDSVNQIKESAFGYYDDLPDVAGRWIYSIDGASTTKQKSDHTAIGLWFVTGFKRYLVKLWYRKFEVPDLIDFVKNLLDTEVEHYDDCLIEYANSGVPLSQFLTRAGYKCTALGFSGNPIDDTQRRKKSEGITKGNSKIERYLRIIPEFSQEEKRIMLPANKIEHQAEFLRQMTTFDGTAGRSDDLVDMATYLIFYTGKNVFKRSVRKNINKTSLHNTNMSYNLGKSNLGNYGFRR